MSARHTALSCAFTLLSFTCSISSAAEFRHLGQPCRPFNILSAEYTTHPLTGKPMLIMGNTNEASGLELLFIDPETNEMKVVVAPDGQGSWALRRVSDDRLVQGTYYDGKFLVYDLKKDAYIKSVQVPGEQYLWNTAMGKDGRVYAGTYPNAVLAALSLDTYEVQSYPHPLPGKRQYLRYVNATADGRIVCTYDMGSSTSLVFDPATEKFTSAPVSMRPLGLTATWNGHILNGREVYDATTLEAVSPQPFPIPPGGKWTVDTYLTTSDTLYLRDGNTIYSYREGQRELTKVAEWDSKVTGTTRGVLPDGRLLCSVGQDTFIVSSDTTSVTLRPLPKPQFVYKSDGRTTTPPTGRPSHFIAADGKGRLWGGPEFGQTLWVIDLATGQTTNTSNVSTRGGEVYDVVFKDDKVYAVSYVGGEVIEYDPAKPFDLFYGGNPHTLANSGGAYIRPSAGVVMDKAGLLYSGYLAKYGTYGGAVYITDPTKPRGSNNIVIHNPLGPQGIQAIAVDDRFIYIGTTLDGNGLPTNPEGTAQIGIMDKATHAVIWKQDLGDRIGSASSFHLDPKTGLLAMRVQGKLRVFDTNNRTFKSEAEAPEVLENITGDGSGHIYFGSGNDLVTYDLAAGKATARTRTPIPAKKVTRDPTTGKLYISSGPDVYEVDLTPKDAQADQ